MTLSQKIAGSSEDGGLVAALAERDAEISSLRAQLEDKEKMISALTSAKKKSEVALEMGSSDSSPGSRRVSHSRSQDSSSSIKRNSSFKIKTPPISLSPRKLSSHTFPTPQTLPTPHTPHTPKSDREMTDVTRMLDEMISGRIDANGAQRSGLRPVSEDR
jgi:centromeric protein E